MDTFSGDVKGEVPRLQHRCQTLSQHQHPIEQVRAVRDLVTSGHDS